MPDMFTLLDSGPPMEWAILTKFYELNHNLPISFLRMVTYLNRCCMESC